MHHPLVEIKKPCHEILENRKPGEPGNYCKSCQTLVIDFTDKSPEEISAYFIRHQQEKICGKFNRSDVSTGLADLVLSFFHARKLKFAALFIMALLIITGCRTRKTRGTTYGGPRILDNHNPSIEHLK